MARAGWAEGALCERAEPYSGEGISGGARWEGTETRRITTTSVGPGERSERTQQRA